MHSFIHKYQTDVTGVLSGFDRLVLRATPRTIAYAAGMQALLNVLGVLLKDAGVFLLAQSQRVKKASLAVAHRAGHKEIYLQSSKISKEKLVQQRLREHPVQQGHVCTLTCVEPCMSFAISPNRELKKLEIRPKIRKCLHIYHYFIHPIVGLVGVRLQTWAPFSIQICLNGREWLSHQMDSAHLAYERLDNCFGWVEDVTVAQNLMDQQLQVAWPQLLTDLQRYAHPLHDEMFESRPADYYWTVYQSEWATDIMFRDPKRLQAVYRDLVRHGMLCLSSPDVMRFLGHRLNNDGSIPAYFDREVTSDFKHRSEGVRIKHRIDANSVKAYDKFGRLLRVETTINNCTDFRVFRPKQDGPEGQLAWLPMRKGIADLHRRAQVSQAVNNRYLAAMADARSTTPLAELTTDLCKHVYYKGRRVRAINPWAEADARLLQAVCRGEFTIRGFRNADLRALLFSGQAHCKKQQRSRSAFVSRQLRLLRAHGLIVKVQRSNRYHLSQKGIAVINPLLVARASDAETLVQKAA